MNDGLIPQRYAMALFKMAKDKKNTDAVYDEMKNVIDAFHTHSGFAKVMTNPFVNRKKKEALLLAAAGSCLEDDYRRFVKLILDNHREAFALEMALAYRKIYRNENHIAQVVITTAVNLPDDEIKKLNRVVEDAFKGFRLEFSYKIDPDIIGGFVIDVDSTRMDASVSNELEQLRHKLLSSN